MSSTEQTTAIHVHRDDVGSRMGMWLFLFTELILFGGMFLIYSVYRFQYPDAFHLSAKGLNIVLGTFNTAVLLTSSMTMALSIVALQRDRKVLSMMLQLITILLAIFFLVNKYFEWSHEIGHGIYPGSEELLSKSSGEILFFGLYYVMTGLHGVHVIVGIVLIGIMTRMTRNDIITKDSYVRLENIGLYWHLVDIIWIFLFPLFYLIT